MATEPNAQQPDGGAEVLKTCPCGRVPRFGESRCCMYCLSSTGMVHTETCDLINAARKESHNETASHGSVEHARQPEINALRERERKLREAVIDLDAWLSGASFNYKGSQLRRDVAELLAAKEGCTNA